MISGNGLIPRFLPEDDSVFQDFAGVLVQEILLVAGDRQMSTPGEHAVFQVECRFGLASHGVDRGIRLDNFIGHLLKVNFPAPRILAFRVALPDDCGFLVSFVADEALLTGPGKADTPNVLTFF